MRCQLKQILIFLSLYLVSYSPQVAELDTLVTYALRDSLKHELQKASTNTKSLGNVLVAINKNCLALNNLYKPLLHEYIECAKRINYKQGTYGGPRQA